MDQLEGLLDRDSRRRELTPDWRTKFMSDKVLVLGAGVTGLAAGVASGCPVIEQEVGPGGICGSYYMRSGCDQRLRRPPSDGDAYRFELGGGHWIFGGEPGVMHLIHEIAPMKRYTRRSGVFFPDSGRTVPYPIQNHLRFFDSETVNRALLEIVSGRGGAGVTMRDWLIETFGRTLCDLFFFPFHDLYTAGLFDRVAPQDSYKSPIDVTAVRRGAFGTAPHAGYNVTFGYPLDGLDALVYGLAARCRVRYGQRVVHIDIDAREVHFDDGTAAAYDSLIATLPLNRLIEITGLELDARADPYTSVLVLNIGAARGTRCPEEHWLYVPASNAGFHRVGFYSNVDASFLPTKVRCERRHVSLYVERAFIGGCRLAPAQVARYVAQVVDELRQWEFIGEVDVVDPTWIDVAYTWSWPTSSWRSEALEALRARSIIPVGRYARWTFQGIADSIREGLAIGQAAYGR